MPNKKGGMTDSEFLRTAGQDVDFENLRKQNRQALIENENLKRELANENRLIDAMVERVIKLPKVQRVAIPELKMTDCASSEPALIITDPHAEELVGFEEMEGMAENNWQSFLAKCWMTLQKTIELNALERKIAKVESINVWFLGDNVTGEIHEHELVGNEFSLPDAIINVAYIYGQFVMALAAHFNEVKCVGVVGNHTRSTKRTSFKRGAKRYWDRAIYRMVQMLTANESRIKWSIPSSMQTVVNVMGWDNYLSHGAEINMNNRVPYYPIESTLQREAGMRRKVKRRLKNQTLNIEFDYAWLGHFHHRAVLADDTFICPAMIGATEFSKSRVHMLSMPRQQLSFFTETHGVSTERTIDLHEASGHSFIDPAG